MISDDDSEDMEEIVSKRREEKSSDSVETITIDGMFSCITVC